MARQKERGRGGARRIPCLSCLRPSAVCGGIPRWCRVVGGGGSRCVCVRDGYPHRRQTGQTAQTDRRRSRLLVVRRTMRNEAAPPAPLPPGFAGAASAGVRVRCCGAARLVVRRTQFVVQRSDDPGARSAQTPRPAVGSRPAASAYGYIGVYTLYCNYPLITTLRRSSNPLPSFSGSPVSP